MQIQSNAFGDVPNAHCKAVGIPVQQDIKDDVKKLKHRHSFGSRCLQVGTLCISGITSLLVLGACHRNEEPASKGPSPAAAPAVIAPTSPSSAATSPAGFDRNSVPLSTANLPPFPYLTWPDGLAENYRNVSSKSDFDQLGVIAGNDVLMVEGRVEERSFPNSEARLSAIASQRNFEQVIIGLGGVKVNKVQPTDTALIQRSGGDFEALKKKLHLLDDRFAAYDVYLIRTAQKSAWIVVAIDESGNNTWLKVVEEKPMTVSVGLLTADRIKAALDANGHVPLYIQFATDSAALTPDGASAVAEIFKLLNGDPGLKLSVEGHTDNVGTADHNRGLSLARAQSVVKALTQNGVAADRLKAAGFGPDKPLADNATEDGRAKNRRVELVKL